MLFVALLYAGCRKEKEIIKDNLPVAGNSTANGQRIDPEDMENTMNDFINHIWPNGLDQLNEPPGPIDNDFEVEAALLIIEAALNYGTCHPDSDYYEITEDSLSFEMDLTRNSESGEFLISGSDLVDFFMLLLDSASKAKNRVSFGSANDPFNIIVDLEFTEFDRESQSSTQTAVVQVIIGVANTPISLPNCEYQSTDNWIAMGPQFSLSGGYGCGNNLGNSTSWATREIMKRLRPSCRGYCDGNYNTYVSKLWFSYYQYNTSGTTVSPCLNLGNQPSVLWYGLNQYYCMSPTDLECESEGMKYLADYYSPIVPGTISEHKSTIGYTMDIA